MKVKNKMDAATALIDGLSGERIRWTEQSAQFKAETERLVGDVLLLVGFLSYAGPFNQEFRATMQKTWLDELIRRKIPVTQGLNISESLTDTATVSRKYLFIPLNCSLHTTLHINRLANGIFKDCQRTTYRLKTE